MSFLVQNSDNLYLCKSTGFTKNKAKATEFKSIFSAMKYLNEQDEEDIKNYEFIEITGRARQNVESKINSNRCRWRTN